MSLHLAIAGVSVRLLPQKALYLPGSGDLLVADLHLGKDAVGRKQGIAIPDGTMQETLSRLDQAIAVCAPSRVIMLGDLIHDRGGMTDSVRAHVAGWRATLPDLPILLVMGNHDRAAIPSDWRITPVGERLALPPFVLTHIPRPDPSGYVLAGHLHPAARLQGRGAMRARLPCFWLRDSAGVGVLPAFGALTGMQDIVPAPGDRVCVIADDTVIAVVP